MAMRCLLLGFTWVSLLTASVVAEAGTLTIHYQLTSGGLGFPSFLNPREPALGGMATLRLPVSGPLTVTGDRATLVSFSLFGANNGIRFNAPATGVFGVSISGGIHFQDFCCDARFRTGAALSNQRGGWWYGSLYGPPYLSFATAVFGVFADAGTPDEYSRASGSFAEVSRTYLPTSEAPAGALAMAAFIGVAALLWWRGRTRGERAR